MARTSFGSHAYWRVVGSQTGVVKNYAAYSAMAFRDPGGSSIAASGGTAIESAHFGSFPVSNLFDGTDATFWESTNSNGVSWAGYHFASAVEVMQIGLQRSAASMDGSFPAVLAHFQYSDNGVMWFTVWTADVKTALALAGDNTMSWFNFAPALT